MLALSMFFHCNILRSDTFANGPLPLQHVRGLATRAIIARQGRQSCLLPAVRAITALVGHRVPRNSIVLQATIVRRSRPAPRRTFALLAPIVHRVRLMGTYSAVRAIIALRGHRVPHNSTVLLVTIVHRDRQLPGKLPALLATIVPQHRQVPPR
jgi:hypothetical protein